MKTQIQYNTIKVVLVVQWFGVGLVIERSLVRLPAGVLSTQLVNSAFHPSGVGKSSIHLHDCGAALLELTQI